MALFTIFLHWCLVYNLDIPADCATFGLAPLFALILAFSLDIPADCATLGLCINFCICAWSPTWTFLRSGPRLGFSASPFSLPLSSEHSSECETLNNLFFWLGELSRSSTRAPTTSLPRPLARWRRMKRDQVPGTRYRHGAGIPWSGVDSKRR